MPKRTELGSLFFDLAHPRRAAILETLREEPRRLSRLAAAARTPAPEASRHLARLVSQGLVQREPGGAYRLTGYGRLVAEGIASFEGLRSLRDFLRTHDLTGLPRRFTARLYELAGGEAGSTVSDALRHSERVLEEAREFAWFLSDQAMLTPDALLLAMRRTRVPVRVLVPRSILPPPRERVTSIPRDVPLEVRALPEVRVGMALNETVAGVCFVGLTGSLDLARGLRGTSPAFRGWCEELFEHYWTAGHPVRVW